MKRPLALLVLGLCSCPSPGTAQSPPANGPRHVDARWHALVHATLIPAPDERIENATVVLRDGVITAVGAGIAPPPGARVWDCTGRVVHAGLIEPYLEVAAPPPAELAENAHWNPVVTPQRSALDGTGVPAALREELRALGFAAAAAAPSGGIFRGTGAVVLLDAPAEDGTTPTGVVARRPFQAVAFDRNRDGYPRSLMGAFAVVRQTLLDADRHQRNHALYAAAPDGREPPPANAALAALGGSDNPTPLLFVCADEHQALAAGALARDHDRPFLILGSGTEFRRLAALAEDRPELLLPLAFPDAPDVHEQHLADQVSLRQLMTWEQAPTNPRRVVAAGLTAALTTHGLERREDAWARLRDALQHGLTPAQALAMLTTVPARMLGLERQLGKVAPGQLANLVVSDGEPFAEATRVLDVWVRGRRHVVHDPRDERLDGTWSLELDRQLLDARLVVDGDDVSLSVADDGERTTESTRNATVTADRIECLVPGTALGRGGWLAVRVLRAGDGLIGSAVDTSGRPLELVASRMPSGGDREPDDADAGDDGDDDGEGEDAAADAGVPEALPTPLGAYGELEPRIAVPTLIRNVTVWHTPSGVIRDGAVLFADGAIRWVGADADAPTDRAEQLVDGGGRHLTPGLIDCHSHTGISRGINEGSQAVTSEVRIADAVDPDDISWYRQLAGGVTMVQQLHGSANPIGGQSNVVKLRWGAARAADLRAEHAAPGIKFALGENPKRARSPDSTRYPGTRMGVEALIRDRFAAARDYAAEWARYAALPPEEQAARYAPRRDLELEALAEILAGDRLVHCHSYRQDEILMLCRVARDFGFVIGTFQHGLECYKVAEAVREAALGASVFSDWWGYKFEVYDAIPDNGAILHRVGVTVSFNSDSNELARRLNTEAGKAVKYGGLDPDEALGFVTSGPAAQLRMEDRVGRIAVGMDADLALWSAPPLSSTARCEATWVDGVLRFSRTRDAELREVAAAERQRILGKLRAKGKKRSRGARSPDGPGLDAMLLEYTEASHERGACECGASEAGAHR